jgi:antitoxin ParD1/3/4
MTLLHVALPDPIKAFVDDQVSKGTYASADEYLASLVEADQQRQLRRDLEEKLLVAARGPSTPMTSRDWAEIRETGHRLISERKSR